MSGFVVTGLKSDGRDNSGLKNELYPLLNPRAKRMEIVKCSC